MNRLHLVLAATLLTGTSLTLAQPLITTIPIVYQKGVPYVRIVSTRKQFRPMRFILDTGASPTVFSKFTASGLNMTGCGNYERGDTAAMYVRQINATCGEIPLKHVAISTDITNISLGCGHWVDGLLGTDYFRSKIVTIDFKNNKLEIQEPESKGLLATLFDGIPFCDRHDSVFVTVKTPASLRPLLFLLDTGSTRTFIDLKVAKDLGMDLATKGQKIRTVGGYSTAFESHHFSGRCEGHVLPAQIYANDLSRLSWIYMKHIDGIVGTDFLQAFRVHINFQTRAVSFE